ncbi:MAG: hypothetical protein AMJ79_15755, partial [Phycisphaerae bacterium SM23_30]
EGLIGEYYERDTTNPWQNLLMKRLDATVNFNWGDGSPDPSVPADQFMVRWTGQVEAPATATYIFYTQTDDGVRLWVNNESIIDNWTDHSSTMDQGSIKLTAGQRYEIQLEFYENGGSAVCQLLWSTPTMPRETIQSQYLWVGGDRPEPRYPNPADGAVIQSTWVGLSWSPGDYGISHSIYIGENRDEVQAGTGDTFRANQTDTDYAVGFTGYPYPDGVVKGTTYYWRIEDVEADGTTTHSGPVWSFTIAPKTAYDPDPADSAESVDPNNVVLRWTPGFDAILHTVFFGDDYNTVNDAVAGALQGIATHKPGPLELGKTYYWRVDEFHGTETVKGEIWSFSTPGAVGSPNPYNGAVNVKHATILTWVAADNAESHQVYFGTDKDAVCNATTASPEYKGSKNLDDEKYDPGPLEQDTTYCWRIDEVDSQNNTSKGNVWTFTTADYLVVDDWESYNDIDPPDPASNTIFAHWMDGYSTPEINGALIGNDLPPYAEQDVVHGGRQSMPYAYDINGKYAEATLTLDSLRDWTASDVKMLTIWFHGDYVNDPATIYVAIANITGAPAVVTHDDSAATQIHAWTRWDIPLQEFADKGINLTDVNTITIGIGDKTNPPGGAGKMYFDDIGLHSLGTEPEPAP